MERKITIEEDTVYTEDYQMRMLKANTLETILKVAGRGMHEKSCYDYDVSGKVSVKAMFERGKISGDDIKTFLVQFRAALREVETYLLDIHCILLKPEYIFYEEGRFFFCYYPLASQDLWQEFHIFTEYLVKQADYQDKECVRMVFLLHKGTMEENYSLEKLAEECLKEQEGEEESSMTVPEDEKEEYSKAEHDWNARQEQGSSIMEENDGMWAPVKRFLHRHKEGWKDWERVHLKKDF